MLYFNRLTLINRCVNTGQTVIIVKAGEVCLHVHVYYINIWGVYYGLMVE